MVMRNMKNLVNQIKVNQVVKRMKEDIKLLSTGIKIIFFIEFINLLINLVMKENQMDMETRQITDTLKVIMVVQAQVIIKKQVTKSIIVQAVMKEDMEAQEVMMKEDMMIKALERIHTPVMFIIHQAPMIKTVPKMMEKRVVKKKKGVVKVMKGVTMKDLLMSTIMIPMIMEIMNLKDLVIVDQMRNRNMLATVVVVNITKIVKVIMVDSHMLVKLIKMLSIN